MSSESDTWYLCEFRTGIQVIHGWSELDRLRGLSVDFKILGTVCDRESFGDHCNTDCQVFCDGRCSSVLVRDFSNQLWHVLGYEVYNSH